MVADWTELEIIKFFSSNAKQECEDLKFGIGDDCAVIQSDTKKDYLVSTDMLVENVHFDLSWHPPHLLGRKCIAVNLSDIAAMGGEPRFAFISVSVPRYISREWLKKWSEGVLSMLTDYNCVLAGGDTVQGSVLTINVTIIGTAGKNRWITRQKAGSGESIFVSGPLGSAAAGLRIFMSRSDRELRNLEKAEPFKIQHLCPEPEVALGKLLNESGMITSMQDISDGLATDLAHICKSSGVSAEVEERLLPCLPDLAEMCRYLDTTPVDLQVSGGEDYRLVFTVEVNKDEELQLLLEKNGFHGICRIGTIRKGRGEVFLATMDGGVKNIAFMGFEHKPS